MKKQEVSGTNNFIMDFLVLVLASLVLFYVTIMAKRRYGVRNLGFLFLCFYLILFLLSLHLIGSPSQKGLFEGQNLIYHLYFIFLLVLLVKPLLQFDNYYQSIPVHYYSERLLGIVLIPIIFLCIFNIKDLYSEFTFGLVQLLTDEGYGSQLYHELREGQGLGQASSSGFNIVYVLSNVAKTVAPFFLLFYIACKNKRKILLIGLTLATLVSFMHSISIGSRIVIVQMGLEILFFYIFMSKYYSEAVRRKTRIIGLFFALVIGAGFFAITISRAISSKEDSPLLFVERYAATPVLNFGKYGLDPGGIRYGDKTFPLVKSVFTSNVARSYYERINKYKTLNLDESNFILFPGDFIIDYGVIIGSFFLFIAAIFFHSALKKRKKTLRLSQLSILYLLVSILVGFYQYSLSDFLGNMKFIVLLLIALFFRIIENEQIRKSKQSSNTPANV